jgi:hypothetical protein
MVKITHKGFMILMNREIVTRMKEIRIIEKITKVIGILVGVDKNKKFRMIRMPPKKNRMKIS